MGDFFKSLNFNYFNTTTSSSDDAGGSGGGGGASSATVNSGSLDNDYVGQFVEISGQKLRTKCVIAEGGYAFVYVAQDVKTGAEYALKRLIAADQSACRAINNEISVHKQLSGHGNIVTCIGSNCIAPTPPQGAQFLLLTELCKGGSLVDCFRVDNTSLDPPVILRIFYQMARAVAHMHTQSPPIAHRDIKIENFLIGNDKQIKLCDFGSASKELLEPTFEWSAHQRNMLEDQLNTVTTPMYRAPEMLDTWSNYPIGPKADIWALGCILYFLCYQKHPYEDGGKLRIINANYMLPPDSRYHCFREIIKGCFKVNPAERFDISMVLERLAAVAETNNWSLKGPLDLRGLPIETSPAESPARSLPETSNSEFYCDNPNPTATPMPSAAMPQTTASAATSHGNGSLFSSLRGGAGTLFKNLKDTSTKVMQTMQQSIARNDLDISHITSRILVMPCPSDGFESTYKTNNIEDVRLSLESRFSPQKISIYNFGSRTVPRLPPPVRTVEAGSVYGCPQAHAPNLQGLFTVSADMYNFLNADPKSVVIVQTGDSGGCTAATVICALLMYAGLLHEPEDAVQVFAVKRHTINLRASEFRYLYYFGDILRPIPLLPHYKNFNLVSLSCQPVPRMTKARDGCRIYMEVYCNEKMLLSTLQDYEKMRLHLAGPGKIVLPINLTVCGDLTIVLYHARNALKGMVRPQGLKICQFQINTGFVPEPETLITFNALDLDDLPDPEQVPQSFCVSLSLSVTETETPPSHKPPWLPAKSKRAAQNLFSSDLEYVEMLDNFVTKPSLRSSPTPQVKKPERSNSPLVLPDVTEIAHDAPATMPEPSPPIDLLNLNQQPSAGAASAASDPLASAMPSSDASFDLLGAFGDDDSTGIGSAPIPDVLPPPHAGPQPKINADLFDIFGSIDQSGGMGTPNLKPTTGANRPPFVSAVPTFVTTPAAPTKEPSPTQPQKPLDPFADIANLASDLNINFNRSTLGAKSAGSTPVGHSPQTTQFSSPTHKTTPSQPQTQPQAQPKPQPQAQAQPAFARTPPQPQSQSQGASSRPDYSRTHFDAPKTSQQSGAGGTKSSDIFGDILGQQGYSFGSKMHHGPRSINEMRKEELVKDMDPKKVIIMEWTDGKKNNIRALLCSMHTVLWENAKWKRCEMSTMVTPAEVKKAYRRACLAVHPDKHNGTEHEEIAKLIFMELNNAWTDFENDATQQNMFNA
ncbi:cyclin-G-associated kinase [Drosophila grimshawi]|uniref:non-specific serine/threonine protein kinase n=1 Tax=Drosophila grimshawi TaxID=7222 RepID=B4JGR2_DROGR|nr:cyclin-G-associated kinase [Drosophila grimshawi]EDV92666.1 GH18708 [Drosophila grimshawi]